MAAVEAVIVWSILTLVTTCTAQTLNNTWTNSSICQSIDSDSSVENLRQLEGCVVIVGNLKIVKMDYTTSSDFVNVSFPELREITGYVIFYRVVGLESLGSLFPNLARIRGRELFNNYGLIVHDLPDLIEIGLYSLLSVDRGGVAIWGGPHTCFILTVDWWFIAPSGRRVLTRAGDGQCNAVCTCSTNASTNYCWNNRKCQRYLVGRDGFECNEQCFGCRLNDKHTCLVCKHYTHRGKCVPQCPNDTVAIPESKYCITEDECKTFQNRTIWNNTCIAECPEDYVKTNSSPVCRKCLKCKMTCNNNVVINHLSSLQKFGRCVYINGSLTIHISAIPYAMDELRSYLNRVQEIRDHLTVYGSISITSLDFLPSLRRINGTKLAQDAYSMTILNMENLQSLFLANVTENLFIGRGTLRSVNNPVLCLSKLEEIAAKFPTKVNETDMPEGMNGYSGGCSESLLNLTVEDLNETSALLKLSPKIDTSVKYTVLYVRLPPGSRTIVVPETCSDLEWYAIEATSSGTATLEVRLTSLRPASTYAFCIEMFKFSSDPAQKILSRSPIHNFSTLVGKPAPPFITELVASSSEAVVLRWVDHKDYGPHITHYELDVILIEIDIKQVIARNHCHVLEVQEYEEDTRYAVVLKPPPDYDRGCQSMCGVLSTLTEGAMVEEDFEICDSLDDDCDRYDEIYQRTNTTFGQFIKTKAISISGSKNDFQIEGLAPYRDYKFKMRACVGNYCSRTKRAAVRTFRSPSADIPTITNYSVDDHGLLLIDWIPPNITNGPVLAYSVQLWPYIGYQVVPLSWCVLPHINNYNLTVKAELASKYKIRVCLTTFASVSACSDWRSFTIPEITLDPFWIPSQQKDGLMWAGIFFGVCVVVISGLLAYIWDNRWKLSHSNEQLTIPLMDDMEMNESEPPLLLTEFLPMYTVPLRDTILDY